MLFGWEGGNGGGGGGRLSRSLPLGTERTTN